MEKVGKRDSYVYSSYTLTKLGRGDVSSSPRQIQLYQSISTMICSCESPLLIFFITKVPPRPRFILFISYFIPLPPISLCIHSSGNFGKSRDVASGY